MKNAYFKDIWRTVRKTKKRFLSILIITALGVAALTGIYAACEDMYLAADRFYDSHSLFDIRILSTLGLTEEDLDALKEIDGIASADGGFSELVDIAGDSMNRTAEMTVLSERDMNRPYVEEGRLPERVGEMAVTRQYLRTSGKSIGDIIAIEELLGDDDSEEEEPAEEADSKSEEASAAEPDSRETSGESKFSTDVDWNTDMEIEDEAEEPTFLTTEYIITGVVLDPRNINNEDSAGFRSASAADFTFFITADSVDTDIYTSVYVTLEGLAELNCHSRAYELAVKAAVDTIESQIMKQRESTRYDAVMAEALGKLSDAEAEMNEKFDEADTLFADAWAEIEDAKRELLDGEAELTREEQDALQKLANARSDLRSARATLAAAEDDWSSGVAELEENAATLAEGREKLNGERQTAEDGFAEAESIFEEKQGELDAALEQAQTGVLSIKPVFGDYWPEAAWEQLVGAATIQTVMQLAENPADAPNPEAIAGATAAEQGALAAAIAELGVPQFMELVPSCVEAALGLGILNGSRQMLDEQKTAYNAQKADALTQLAEAEAGLADGEMQLEDGRTTLSDARAELDNGWAELRRGEIELNIEEAKALNEISDAWQEIADGKKELADGESELTENEATYLAKREEAEQKLADAYRDLEDIDMTQWYVQDRTSLDSYSSLKNDLSSIEVIARAFPVVFLLVAILISLTTMTRMVEEERGLIGIYKAVGFSDGATYSKYLLYALLAALLGGALGDFLGFVVLPTFLLDILNILYVIPETTLAFNAPLGLGGIALFVACTIGATAMACHSELKQTPAALMRPKAPKAGGRVLLERIPPIWNRFSFLNKVTARNLFRYKKRMFMTIAGITGCTALVLLGFAIRDSVLDMMPKQYGRISQYDLLLAADAADNADLLRLTEGEAEISDYLNMQVGNIKLLNNSGDSESIQMMIVPRDAPFGNYINLIGEDGNPAPTGDSGILITKNSSEILHLSMGDTVYMQNQKLDRRETKVAGIVENYLGNTVYVPQALYEKLFEPSAPNAILAKLSTDVSEHEDYARELRDYDFIATAVSTEGIRKNFGETVEIINTVIYILIILAAALAFVVLFTLSNTNISERLRELATIQVLGFYDREIHSYVNKETLILTMIGVVAGLPFGYFVSGLLLQALKMPSLYFSLYIRPGSYVISALLSFSFALAVNLMTNRTLDKINMVEALKSVE